MSDRDWSGFYRGRKNRQCWYEARDELTAAGFEEHAVEYTRMMMDRDGVRLEHLGITGPHGSWVGIVERDGVRHALRGPKGGLRLFKTATACLEALERQMGTFEIGPPLCAEHVRDAIDKR